MLTKLIKQEFLATARVMGLLYLAMLVLTFVSRLITDGLGDLGAIIQGLSMLALTACGLLSLAIMVLRFKRNLLGDEGYVMLTLPVSVHQHLWSKLIVSTIWFVVSMLMTVLAVKTIQKDSIWSDVPLIKINGIELQFTWNALLVLELLVLVLVGFCTICLQFYAALAAGHSFSRHKMALSVAWFVGLNAVTSFVVDLVPSPNLHFRGNLMADVHQAIWLIIAGTVVVGAVYYAITAYCLKKHLNLS